MKKRSDGACYQKNKQENLKSMNQSGFYHTATTGTPAVAAAAQFADRNFSARKFEKFEDRINGKSGYKRKRKFQCDDLGNKLKRNFT